jgi:hypothetical protein
MDSQTKCLDVYRELADWYEKRGQAPMRDRFLVLAADAALAAGSGDEAERLRLRLLQLNPHHMLKPYSSFAQALEAPDVSTYVRDLRQNYPLEVAAELLRMLPADEDRALRVPQVLPPTAPVINPDPDQTLALGAAGPPNRTPSVSEWGTREEGRKAGERAGPAPESGARGAEQLKVYPLREDDDATIHMDPSPATPPSAGPAPRKESAPAGPAAAGRSPDTPVPRAAAPLPRPTPPPAPMPPLAYYPDPPPPAPEPHPAGGDWLASLLFGVVATAGAALAVYTLARPF